MDSSCKTKPHLYRNSPLPLDKLSPNSFEDFTYQSLSKLSSEKGFKMESGRQPSGDGGFDCVARDISTNDLICIQCKRYTDTLYSGTVVEELVKVSLNGVLDRGIPKKHYIITSGSVGDKLRRQLRQDNYIDIKNLCKELIEKGEALVKLIKNAKDKTYDPFEVVCTYIDNLQELVVWSGVDFQNELIGVWSRLSDVLEEHFSLAIALKEHPRPDFNASKYLENKKIDNEKLVPLFFQQAPLPNKLSVEEKPNESTNQRWSTEYLLSVLKIKQNVLISSVGGSGKSSTLSIIEMALQGSFSDELFLPIRIDLRSYSRNTLKQKIDQELGINFGSWKSLPFKFIFIFDALDEMLQYDTQAFIDELRSEIKGYNFVLTVRSTGLNIETTLPYLDHCISVQPLSYQSAFQIAEKDLNVENFKLFTDSYREKLSQVGFNFLTLPFAFLLTIDLFKRNKEIPDSIEDILQGWVDSKIKYDGKKVRDTNNKLNKIPHKFIEQAFSLILYKSRIDGSSHTIPEDKYHILVMDCYDELNSSKSYLSKALDFDEFVTMISHFEILVLGDDGFYSTPHPILSDYLISKVFADNWRNFIEHWLSNSFQDVWLYASNFLKQGDQKDFLSTLLSLDLSLAAKVAKKFGQDSIEVAERAILEAEQSNKVLKRSEAIFALGVLGTVNCLERLRSTENAIDHHHLTQRGRSLAFSGDLNMLKTIFESNERIAETPINMSGGDYELWFNSPPSIITGIARKRLNQWVNNPTLLLCFSLQTIELFGDSSDIDLLIKVAEQAKNSKELVQACRAINEINSELTTPLLTRLIGERHAFSHEMKRLLLSLGKTCDIGDAVDYFLKQIERTESELAAQKIMHHLRELAQFIERFGLDQSNQEKLIEAYKGLKFSNDFYIYQLFWSIAISCKSDFFLSIVESAFTKGNYTEIHHAMFYLSKVDNLIISEQLSNKVDSFFDTIGEGLNGIKHNYFKYYKKYENRDRAKKIFDDLLAKQLSHLEPETITHQDYISGGLLNFSLVELFESEEGEMIDDSVSLKLLLISTDCLSEFDKVKSDVLRRIDKSKIENFRERIKDTSVLLYVTSELLKKGLLERPVESLKTFFPQFLSHHIFHKTILKVCDENWNDDLARIFLSCFVDIEWDVTNAQMFDKYTSFFVGKLTKEQMAEFESQRTQPINDNVQRIYQIWVEHTLLESPSL
jgi:hypothetical protein